MTSRETFSWAECWLRSSYWYASRCLAATGGSQFRPKFRRASPLRRKMRGRILDSRSTLFAVPAQPSSLCCCRHHRPRPTLCLVWFRWVPPPRPEWHPCPSLHSTSNSQPRIAEPCTLPPTSYTTSRAHPPVAPELPCDPRPHPPFNLQRSTAPST